MTIQPENAKFFVSILRTTNDPQDPNAACSGVLTTPRTVATAAHCLREGATYTVYRGPIGSPENQQTKESAIVSRVDDLGRLFLSKAFSSGSAIALEHGSSPKPLLGKKAFLYGAGRIPGAENGNGVRSTTINILTVRTEPYKPVKSKESISENKFQVVNDLNKERARGCSGDSGGPLVYIRKNPKTGSDEVALLGITIQVVIDDLEKEHGRCTSAPVMGITVISWAGSHPQLYVYPG
ncbi:trypsin-like serine protease [Kitasatospora sp. NPDC089509]|uniref:trypsin-like serine protease n=1 Tax=Kitasatospora sp. NPDC089509 TaxID=3364079 RepID=UPI0038122354